MAKLATSDAIDRFCWRNLTPAEYQGLQGYEACVVTGHEEKRNEERENLGVFWYENPK